jgi:hypothetical protein
MTDSGASWSLDEWNNGYKIWNEDEGGIDCLAAITDTTSTVITHASLGPSCSGNGQFDSGENYRITVGYPGLDQIGRGQSASLYPRVSPYTQPQAAGTVNIWSNTLIASLAGGCPGTTQDNGHVCNMKPAWMSEARGDYCYSADEECEYNYTPYPYPHPLAQTGPDTTPPVRSNGQPTGNLPAGTTQTIISLTTNENANCRYSTTSGVSYPSMTNTFSTTGGTTHSHNTLSINNRTQRRKHLQLLCKMQ